MALVSMTGFGRGTAEGAAARVEVEFGCVNRKQFDARLTLPRSLAPLEARLSGMIRAAVPRGSVQGAVRVLADGGRRRRVAVDERTAEDCVRALRRAARRLGLEQDLSARSLLSMPDVVRATGSPEEDPNVLWPLVRKAAAAALRALRAMQRAEGGALERDLRARLAGLRRRLAAIRRLAPGVPKAYRATLGARLRAAGVPIPASDPALLRELALFADRCDISEEITRLDSHLAQSAALFGSGRPVGRTLDFLCQEMFREINTIASKANNARIAAHTVHFKTDLETIREQAQNVE
jgi:uncharacterized protein (TIGR00255 family)